MKINWVGEVAGITLEKTEQNIAHTKTLGLSAISNYPRPSLAIVGGGPSSMDHVDELRAWVGDMWVSGSAFQWALSVGLANPTFFTIDQSPQLAVDGKGARKAILATCCDPSVFEELKHSDIEVFDLITSGLNANHWATTVTAAPKISLDMGYRDISFFGCDSSFRGDAESFKNNTHAYVTDLVNDALIVRCGGRDFITRPSFLMQADFLKDFFRIAPQVFRLRCDGLLASMVEDPEHDVTHAVHEVAKRIMKK